MAIHFAPSLEFYPTLNLMQLPYLCRSLEQRAREQTEVRHLCDLSAVSQFSAQLREGNFAKVEERF